MQTILQFVTTYQTAFLLGVFILFVLNFITTLINISSHLKFKKRWEKTMGGRNGDDIQKILDTYIETINTHDTTLTCLHQHIEQLEKQQQFCIQRIGMVRYNLNGMMGGNMSYSFALLDNHLNGIIVSGLFGREQTINYAKPVANGKSTYRLSNEEEKALQQALNKVPCGCLEPKEENITAEDENGEID